MKNRLTPLAKQLRQSQTDAERALWFKLRAGRLQGLKFKRQVPKGDYVVDFVCEAQRLVIELDGGQHGEEANKNYDEQRTLFLRQQSYEVVRFWNNDVLNNMDGVLTAILEKCERL